MFVCWFISLKLSANYLLVIGKIGEHQTKCRFYECPKIRCVRRGKNGIFGTNSKLLGFLTFSAQSQKYENDMNFMTDRAGLILYVNSGLIIDSM